MVFVESRSYKSSEPLETPRLTLSNNQWKLMEIKKPMIITNRFKLARLNVLLESNLALVFKAIKRKRANLSILFLITLSCLVWCKS
jgi:hypothetical protein